MMGVFKRLLGSNDVVQAGIDGIDATFFTDEEKSRNWQRLLELYEPFKVAQRYAMLIFCTPYSICFTATFIASFFNQNVAAQIKLLQGDMGTIVSIIVLFYFGGGAVEGFIKRKTERKGDK